MMVSVVRGSDGFRTCRARDGHQKVRRSTLPLESVKRRMRLGGNRFSRRVPTLRGSPPSRTAAKRRRWMLTSLEVKSIRWRAVRLRLRAPRPGRLEVWRLRPWFHARAVSATHSPWCYLGIGLQPDRAVLRYRANATRLPYSELVLALSGSRHAEARVHWPLRTATPSMITAPGGGRAQILSLITLFSSTTTFSGRNPSG
jgi:hypothetical protein